MSWIKKYVYLQHKCSNKSIYIILGYMAFLQVIMFSIFFDENPSNDDNLFNITTISYMLSVLAMFLISLTLNQNLKFFTFLRVSRKRHYISAIVYTFIVSALFSVSHIVLAFINGFIFKNVDLNKLNNTNLIFRASNIRSVFGQFVFSVLLFFLVGLMLNIMITIMVKYSPIYFFPFSVGGAAVCAMWISYLQTGNLIVIDCVLIVIIALLIYGNLLLVRKIDIKD